MNLYYFRIRFKSFNIYFEAYCDEKERNLRDSKHPGDFTLLISLAPSQGNGC